MSKSRFSFTTVAKLLSHKQMLRNLFLLTCFSLAFYFYWVQVPNSKLDEVERYITVKHVVETYIPEEIVAEKYSIEEYDIEENDIEENDIEKHFTEKLLKVKPITDKYVTEKRVIEGHVSEKRENVVTEKHVIEKSVTEKRVVKEHVPDKQVPKKHAIEKIATKKLIVPDLNPNTFENTTKEFNHSQDDKNKNKHSEDLKYMLLWTEYTMAPFYFFEEGQKSFIKNNCSRTNCYVTKNRTLFGGDIKKFHAVAINGRTMSLDSMPKERSPHQKYIYFNMESADNFAVCDEKYDGFFNWTSTYKLDSDIPFPYIAVKNKQGDIVGPQTNMGWPQEFPEIDDDLATKLANKTKAAAWFVSHCKSKSGRDQLVKKLQKALKAYGHTVDVYGRCGPFQCPRNDTKRCNFLLERDYFFYMSLENSFAEDYVTEKLLTPLQHDTVPIVLGGANYFKFLPAGSYIDSTQYNAKKLAAIMNQFMKSPEKYKRFFRWKDQYAYSDPTRKENICAVCAALNNKEKFETKSVHDQFRKWWNPKKNTDCKK